MADRKPHVDQSTKTVLMTRQCATDPLELEYREETGMSPKCYQAGGSDWFFNDDYVWWLEDKIKDLKS
jgi:hypothetical protein